MNMAEKHLCRHCKGSGRVPCIRCAGTGTFENGQICNYCHGERFVECPACKGEKYIEDK